MIVNGLVTLRSFDKIGYFKQDFLISLEKCANVTFCYIATMRWMGVRFDLICAAFSSATTILAVLQRGKVNSDNLTITMQLVSDLIAMFSFSIRMYAEF